MADPLLHANSPGQPALPLPLPLPLHACPPGPSHAAVWSPASPAVVQLKEAQAAAPTVSVDEVPALVATAWQEVLGVPPEGDADDFFAAGGNSMAAMQLVSRLGAATGLALSGTLVFRHRTPAALAAALVGALQVDEEAAEGGRHAGGAGMHVLPKAGFTAEELAHGVPASVQQEQMLFLHEQDPESGAYNICDAQARTSGPYAAAAAEKWPLTAWGAARINRASHCCSTVPHSPTLQWLEGEVDGTALRAALGALLQHQPQLRTRFLLPSDAEGAPAGAVGGATTTLQVVAPAPQDAAVALASGSAVLTESTARDEAGALALLRGAANQAFSLYAAPLMRALLVRLPRRRALLAVVVHHSVSDGWSRGLMVRDLASAYNAAAAAASGGAEAAAAAAAAALPPLPLDYTDWAAAQRGLLATTGVDEQLAWWQARLSGVDMVVALPPRTAGEADATANTAAAIPVSLPAELVAKLQRLAQECKSTLYCVLMAAFQVRVRLAPRALPAALPVGAPARQPALSPASTARSPHPFLLPLQLLLGKHSHQGEPAQRAS